jgi:hypothetical protein
VADDLAFVSSPGPNLSPEADQAVRRVGIIAIVLGILALMFLAGISIGLLMLSSDDGEDVPTGSTYDTVDGNGPRTSGEPPGTIGTADPSPSSSSSSSTPGTTTTEVAANDRPNSTARPDDGSSQSTSPDDN